MRCCCCFKHQQVANRNTLIPYNQFKISHSKVTQRQTLRRLIDRKIRSRMRDGAPGLDNEVWPSGHFVRSYWTLQFSTPISAPCPLTDPGAGDKWTSHQKRHTESRVSRSRQQIRSYGRFPTFVVVSFHGNSIGELRASWQLGGGYKPRSQ